MYAKFTAGDHVIEVRAENPDIDFGPNYNVVWDGDLLCGPMSWTRAVAEATSCCISVTTNGAPIAQELI